MRIDEGILKEFINKLTQYRKLTGHGFVPVDWPEDPRLAQWSSYWRANWAKLSITQRRLLKEAGFVYTKAEISWFLRYYELRHFLQTHKITDLTRQSKKLYDWYYGAKADAKNDKLGALRTKLLQEIGVNFEERRPTPDKIWMLRYNELAAFRQKHGHSKVPSNIDSLRPLYDWTCIQRRREVQRRLPDRQRKLLEEIDFVWRTAIEKNRKDRWEAYFQQLIAYKKKFGTTIVTSIDTQYHSLRVWTDKQRQHFETLDSTRRKKLLSIGFRSKRELKSEKDHKWEEMFQRLKMFYNKYKHSRVPVRSKEFSKLGDWVAEQRENKDKLSKDKRKKLMQLKFEWNIQEYLQNEINRHWEEKFKQMEEFYRQHGHSRITQRHRIRGMVRWMQTQRKNKFKLSPEQVKKLNSVRFEWTVNRDTLRQERFDHHYNDLLVYYQKHGNCDVPIGYEENPSLGTWVYHIKKHRIKLTGSMRYRLEKINFQWAEKQQ